MTSGTQDMCVLAINAGSSSLKFALYRAGGRPELLLTGKFDRILLPQSTLTFTDARSGRTERREVAVSRHADCLPLIKELMQERLAEASLEAIGHRVVHGGPHFAEPVRVDNQVLEALRECRAFAPQHVPVQLEIIEALGLEAPGFPQVACFDTGFHAGLPLVARMLPIPRRHYDAGVRRYGFHGLSYTFLMEELERIAGPQAAAGKIILAHLGNGCSMAAVHQGGCVDTTMGFTPAAGLVMSTRPGDLDPGLAAHLARTEGMTHEDFHEMINKHSGLLGISASSSDVRDLLAREDSDPHAAQALDVFCYQARKWLGALSAALGGLDTLAFSGGIGENAPAIRARICQDLGFLGIAVDPQANRAGDPVISPPAARVTVRVIPTDEELLIARQTCRLLGLA